MTRTSFSALYVLTRTSSYLANHDPGYPSYVYHGTGFNPSIGANGGIYNRAGRGFPDVSANGVRLLFYDGGILQPEWGTSLAAPIWGSVISLINEKRAQAGKKSVGFVHPVLYKHPEVFNDIVKGHNQYTNVTGFRCAPGWDPVTGLGTPNYPKLLDLFLSLP